MPLSSYARPLRNCGEAGASYALRLADANGYPNGRWFCREIGITLGGLATGRMLSTVATVGRCDIGALVRDTPSKWTDGFRIGNQFLGNGLYVRSTPRRFCPECFREDIHRPEVELTLPREWHRVWWDITGVTACHRHRARLQWRCACGSTFDHDRAGIGHCRCSYRLSQMPSVAVGSADAAAYIVGRLGYSEPAVVPVLDELDLGDAIRGIRTFGMSLTGPEADQHEVMESGYRALAGGDEGVRDALDLVALGRPERPGAIGAYGDLHAFARDTAKGRGSPRLLGLMRDHAEHRWEPMSVCVFG